MILVPLRITTFALCAAFACGCANSPTSPSATTTTTTTTATTVATPAYSEQFTGKVAVNGSSFYSFTVTQYGTVNVTLTDVGGQYVPQTVTLGLGMGVPEGEDCAASTTANVKAGSSPQITATYDTGVHCVRIYDVGNLYSAANFNITIDYP